MEIFKQKCRHILNGEVDLTSGFKAGTSNKMEPQKMNEDLEGEPGYYPEDEYYMNSHQSAVVDQVDIITAYKSLKLAMSKTVKGLGDVKEQLSSKGYLKSTMASR